MNEMQHIEKQVAEVNTKVTSILVLLKGHDLDKDDKGMIGVQNDHESRLQKLEKTLDRMKYLLIGVSIPAGWGIVDIVQKIILK